MFPPNCITHIMRTLATFPNKLALLMRSASTISDSTVQTGYSAERSHCVCPGDNHIHHVQYPQLSHDITKSMSYDAIWHHKTWPIAHCMCVHLVGSQIPRAWLYRLSLSTVYSVCKTYHPVWCNMTSQNRAHCMCVHLVCSQILRAWLHI